MATVAERLPTALRRPGPALASGFVLVGVPWATYEKLVEAFSEHHVRLTYDRGTLEIMAPLWNHEWWKTRFRFLLLALAYELKLGIQGTGSPTIRREDVGRGLEPDEGFYLGATQPWFGRREPVFPQDPPPDLALEMDITRSSLDRLGVYAALEIPEVWRCDGQALQVYVLRTGGDYEQRPVSPRFPSLPVPEVVPLLHHTEGMNDIEMLDHFRAWTRQHVLPGLQGTSGNA